jgi:hypothetical protein
LSLLVVDTNWSPRCCGWGCRAGSIEAYVNGQGRPKNHGVTAQGHTHGNRPPDLAPTPRSWQHDAARLGGITQTAMGWTNSPPPRLHGGRRHIRGPRSRMGNRREG